jgi:putative phosphoesterase
VAIHLLSDFGLGISCSPLAFGFLVSDFSRLVQSNTGAPMIVGILSDTHGRADMAHAAVRLLIANKAEYLVHCGDVGGTDVLDALAGHPSMFVFGNNDYDESELKRYAGNIGVTCGGRHGKLTFGNKTGVVTHGDDLRLMNRLIREQQIDYLFLGHTHATQDHREGRIHIINPGALYRASVKTVAVLDTVTDLVRFLTIA